MRAIGIGETVFDIVFDTSNKPLAAVPGGSAFNAIISIGRSGKKAFFASEVGDDKVGSIIASFLRQNGVDDSGLYVQKDMHSPLSLAFLDESRNAHYQFYKDHYNARTMPIISLSATEDDVVLYGSYFAVNPNIRSSVKAMLQEAVTAHSLLYYDVNFRSAHIAEVDILRPAIEENMMMSTIVKGSDEDFHNIYGTADFRNLYVSRLSKFCPYLICTCGADGAYLLSPNGEWHVASKPITPISTIGAGDSFNAGVVCGLMSDREPLNPEKIARAMQLGNDYAVEVCLSTDNYIAPR